MPDVGERLDNVEQRLGTVETGLKEVREEVRDLRMEVGGLREEVGGLRVLGEKNAEDIKKVAEVQTHHGEKLDDIVRALEPLGEIHDFIRRAAPNHELRIEELEKRTGIRQ
jgi:hypothetical protein